MPKQSPCETSITTDVGFMPTMWELFSLFLLLMVEPPMEWSREPELARGT
jgi:hypothetical protein